MDALRGLVMVIMALDHARDFLSSSGQNPQLAQVSSALFVTRWVTHICAPTFVFLAGVSAWFYFEKRQSHAALSRYLLTRGIWLIFLEFTVTRFAISFNFAYARYSLAILWVLGLSMILLAALSRLPSKALVLFCAALILGHNAFDSIHFESIPGWNELWKLLHDGGLLYASPDHKLNALYPLIPWPAVMALGYFFGKSYLSKSTHTVRLLLTAALASLSAFIILRTLNFYGDPAPWSHQNNGLRSLLSFINLQKYPPSLDYILMTLGASLLIWAVFEKFPSLRLKPLVIFGRVPLFYFLIHLYLLHAAAWIAAWLTFHSEPGFSVSSFPNHSFGFPLPIVYLVWILGVASLYPICLWYAGVKKRSNSTLLQYL